MVGRAKSVVLSLALLVLWTGVGLALEGTPQFAAIDAAAEAGAIDAEQALLYKFMYVFDQEKLPVAYLPADAAPLKCATPLIVEFEQLRADFSPGAVETIERFLSEPAGDKAAYVSPAGWFQLSYFTTGTNAVPADDVAPANGIPDYVELCAEYLDTTWDTEITTLGFTGPPLTPSYQISFEDMSAYGYTTVVSGTETRIVLENDFVGFPPNDDPDGDALGAAKVTCAHEFKHASQRATSLWSEGGWVELDATWAEDVVFDDTNDYYNYLYAGSGISSPQVSLDGGSTGTGSYEDCIWQMWMSETYGNQIIVDLWDYRATHQSEFMLTSYNTVLTTYGYNVSKAFKEFAAWNYATGARALAGIGYSEAADYNNSYTIPVATYPYSNSGLLDHLASIPFFCTGFEPGEPGLLRLQFDGDVTVPMGLIAVIEKNDGTGVFEPLGLDANRDFDGTLSVPLGDIAQVGVVISNSSSTTFDKTWALTISKDVPDPVATMSAASVALTLDPDVTADELITLSNDGPYASRLDYAAYVMADAPAAKAAADAVTTNAAPRTLPELQQSEMMSVSRYVGDCVLGNNNTADVQGYYPEWWAGNETYAMRINPANYACSCNPGFNVRAVHMLLRLETTSAPQVQAHLATANAACTGPGTIIDSSLPLSISGIGADGYYDIEVAADFACQDMDSEYFLLFEFLDAAGPVGIPVDTAAQPCVYYNDWGDGYVDVVNDYSFAGGILIWADVDCCGVAVPEASVITPNGGEAAAVGSTQTIEWSATLMADVKVELSRDGGGAWETVLASTPNDGSEDVTITGPVSQNCLLRVGSLDGVTTDTSDAPFWIYDAVPWLIVAPEFGEIQEGLNDVLTLSFDSTGLAPGDHTAYLVVKSNSTTSPEVVPVTLTVNDSGSSTGDAPRRFALLGAAPNPFNPTTTVRFSLAEAGPATVSVLDLQGRIVRRLHTGFLPAGERAVVWDGRDSAGRSVASGAYLVRLASQGQAATLKVILAK